MYTSQIITNPNTSEHVYANDTQVFYHSHNQMDKNLYQHETTASLRSWGGWIQVHGVYAEVNSK